MNNARFSPDLIEKRAFVLTLSGEKPMQSMEIN
jgi:hypothetical protein